MSATYLPIEIIATIIEALASVHFVALKQCCCVCKAWLPLCRRHIFNQIHITPALKGLDPRMLDFSNAIRVFSRESPHLREFVRDLTVEFDENLDEVKRWASELSECLIGFRALQAIQLSGPVGWLDIPPSITAALVRLFERPHFERLCIAELKFCTRGHELVDILSACSRSLSLLFLGIHATIPCRHTSPRHIEEVVTMESLLSIHIDGIAFPAAAFDRIAAPRLEYFSAPFKASWPFSKLLPSTLKRLLLQSIYSTQHLPDFGTIICPESLFLHFQSRQALSNIFTWVPRCIDRLPSPHQLHKLSVVILQRDTQTMSIDVSVLSPLRDSLLALYRHGSLTSVKLSIFAFKRYSGTSAAQVTEQDVEAPLKSVLGELIEAGVLQLQVSFDDAKA